VIMGASIPRQPFPPYAHRPLRESAQPAPAPEATPTEEPKPADKKPGEKPADKKPAEKKPADKPAEKKPADKPAEKK